MSYETHFSRLKLPYIHSFYNNKARYLLELLFELLDINMTGSSLHEKVECVFNDRQSREESGDRKYIGGYRIE